MRNITKIILHCSATKEGRAFTTADIDEWHRQRGFLDRASGKHIGYHFVIYLDGSIHVGRPESSVGAHCKGHNSESIGICYIGGLDSQGRPKDTRTPAQRAAMWRLVRGLRQKYPGATVHGHCEFAAKACPCFDVKSEAATL